MMSHASLISSGVTAGSFGFRKLSICWCTSDASTYPSCVGWRAVTILHAVQTIRRNHTMRCSFGPRSLVRTLPTGNGVLKKPEVGELPHEAPDPNENGMGGVPQMLPPGAPNAENESFLDGMGESANPKPMGVALNEPCCCTLARRSRGSGMSSASSNRALLPR